MTNADFQTLKRKQPEHGDVLISLTGKPVVLTEEQREENGKIKKGIFCRTLVSVEQGGWFLTDEGVGLVCMIMPESQATLVRNDVGQYTVKSLRVVRYTASGRALLCETVGG